MERQLGGAERAESLPRQRVPARTRFRRRIENRRGVLAVRRPGSSASWQFGVSASSQHPEGASAFIQFALQDKYLADFSNGIGLIPATASSAAMTDNHNEGGPMAVFFDLTKAQALVRPVTPGYVVEAKVFEKALADIANGAEVGATLDAATDEINAEIEKNGGYGH